MSRRRVAGAGLGVAAVLATVVPLALHAHASGPSNASMPDFANSPPVQQTAPTPWDYEVVTGGISPGQQVTFTFLYNGKIGDRFHSVNFPNVDPTSGGPLATSIKVMTLPSLPAGLPVGPVQTQMCTATNTSSPSLVQVDPYAQTITLTMHDPEAAGTVLVYCFRSSPGVVGFPTSTTSPNDPTSQYSLAYTEPSGSTSATYSVAGQNPTAPATSVVTVLDPGGADLTDRGLGGTRPLVYGATYNVTLHGIKATQYQVSGGATDATSNVPDNSQPVMTGTSSFGTCTGAVSYFCTDPQSGNATGTLTLHSSNENPDYVAIVSLALGTTGKSESAENVISVTIGPAGAPPPTAGSVSTPTPLAPGASPSLAPFDPNCSNPLASARGLGSRDVLDAANQVLIPDATSICSYLSGTFSYTGINDQVGINSALNDQYTTYGFAGLDRSLTASEYANYTAPGAFGGGVEQFPIFIEPIVVTYNLNAPGCTGTSRVNLRSQVLSLIFMGQITRWNNQLITQDNSSLSSCNLPILVAHDIGQASSVFKDYLSKRNSQWVPYKQPQLADAWPSQAPVSCTANGSRAMALCVAGQPGMIGYGYYRYIHLEAGLPVAGVDNQSGTSNVSTNTSSPGVPSLGFQSTPLDPTNGCQAAATNNPNEPQTTNADWSNASITDPATGYPICAFDFVVAHTQCAIHVSYTGLRAFLGAVYLSSVQNDLIAHGFAPLPDNVVQTSEAGIGNQTTVPNPAHLGQC